MPSARLCELLEGIRDEAPLLVGVVPFGMIYGVLALQAGLGVAEAQAMSSVLFAGSAQFISVQLFGAQAPVGVVVLTAFVVNLRHALYSASVAPHVRHLGAGWKTVLSYLLTDEAYAVAITRYTRSPVSPDAHWYFLGAGLALWTSWQVSTALGIFLGAQVPAGWSLDFTLALTFIALLVPNLRDLPGLAAAVTAGAIAVAARGLPYRLGLVLAACGGISAGMVVEWAVKRRRRAV
jgi:4-azaleucine resistance transporter AzlC